MPHPAREHGSKFASPYPRKDFPLDKSRAANSHLRNMRRKIRGPMNIRILLADDHTILRAGLKMMLNAQPDMEVVGEAQDGRQALQEAQRLQPDIILMDITMPDMNGIEATKQIKKELPDVKVLILTMHEHEEYVFQALRAGA